MNDNELSSHRRHRPFDRSVAVCADDYGFRPGIGIAIRLLAGDGRLSSVSCMVLGSHWQAESALWPADSASVEVGLHFVLTDLAPASEMPHLAPSGRLPGLRAILGRSVTGGIDAREIAVELHAQLDRFERAYGGPPAFLDGHLHVHQLPGIGSAVLAVYEERLAATGCWLRRSAASAGDLLTGRAERTRAAVVTVLGGRFCAAVERRGYPSNGCFRGLRRFSNEPPYPVLFQRFVTNLGPRPLIMCHPGTDDGTTVDDPIAAARCEEFAFFRSAAFGATLERQGVRIAPLSELPAVARDQGHPGTMSAGS